MKLKRLFVEDRAVSPVVGVALLIAITVILAAVIGGVVLGLGTGGVDTPQAQLELDVPDDGEAIELRHNGGEPLEEDKITVGINGANDYELNDDLTAGSSVEINDDGGNAVIYGDAADVDDGDEVVILWEDPNSDSTTVLESFEV